MLKLLAGTALVAILAQTAPHSGMQHKHKPQVAATPTSTPEAKSISEKGLSGPLPPRPSPRPSPKPGVKFGSE